MFALLAASAPAQQLWQRMQMPSAAEVAKVWKNPPSEYGPEPYYGLNGPATLETVEHDLDTMKSLGFRAVTVQAGGGMLQPYLSPEYFAFFKQFVAEAKRRDMRLWIVDDIGYPSGFAGGRFSGSPELQMQALTIGQRLPAKSGGQLKQSVSADAIAATAVSSTGEKVPVPITAGVINWTAPVSAVGADATWTVLVVTHVLRTSPTKSDTNPTHLKDSTQPLEDYLNPAATAAYLDSTHNGYYQAMPEAFGTTILGFRGDEPDYSISGLPWTSALLDRFQQVKGYDARPYLAAMLTSQAGRGETPAKLTDPELRAKADYYDVFSQMFRDGFFKPQGDWCAAHHVEYQVHLNHEEMEMQLVRSEGEFIRDMKYVQVPGIDTIWHQIWTDTVSDFPRLAASAAHIYGHPRAFTESYAAYRPEPDIALGRYIVNEQIVRGINLIETMHYSSTAPPPVSSADAAAAPTASPLTSPPAAGAATTPPRPRGGPSALMRDPGYPALMAYSSRLSYVLSMGRPAASVALYLPSDSMWMGDSKADEQFVAAERLLSEHQVDFDIVNMDALATDLRPGTGTLTTASGNAYRTVILPAPSVLSNAAAGRLRAFAAGGGHVVFLGHLPALLYDRTIKDGTAPRPGELAFATVVEGSLPAVPTPPAQPPPAAPAPMEIPAGMLPAVLKAIGPGDVTLDTQDTAFKVLTRQLADGGVYFFFNEGAQRSTHAVTLQTKAQKMELWDAETGTVSPLASTRTAAGTVVKLDLKPYETRLLVAR